jgi:hypothetical protein
MKVFGKAAALFGAVALMGGIIVAQADYQQSRRENALAQTPTVAVSEAISAAPGCLHSCA